MKQWEPAFCPFRISLQRYEIFLDWQGQNPKKLIVNPKRDFFWLLDVEKQRRTFLSAPVAHHACFSRQNLQFIDKLAAGHGISTQTHQVACFLLAINKFETVYPGGDFEKLEEILVRERYLKKYIELPTEDCSYGFITTKNGGVVFCKHHGTEKSKTIPEYDKSKEKPISLQLYQYKKDLRKDRQSKYSTLIVIRGILDPTALISIGLIFIALVIDKILQRRKR